MLDLMSNGQSSKSKHDLTSSRSVDYRLHTAITWSWGSAPLSFNMRFYTTHRLQLSYITSKASAVDYKSYSMLIGTSRTRLLSCNSMIYKHWHLSLRTTMSTFPVLIDMVLDQHPYHLTWGFIRLTGFSSLTLQVRRQLSIIKATQCW